MYLVSSLHAGPYPSWASDKPWGVCLVVCPDHVDPERERERETKVGGRVESNSRTHLLLHVHESVPGVSSS